MANVAAHADLVRRKQARWAAGEKRRAALLLRVSDKKQARDDQDVPIPVQRDYCLRLVAAHEHEWELATRDLDGRREAIEYTEAGVSAFKLSKDDRELLAAAMLDAAADRFDILVIYKTDRLSRNSEEYPIIIRQFAQMGVEIWVYETGQPLKSSTQVDKLLRFVEGWQAETESVNTRIRVTNAMRRMAEQGAWTGGKTSYGYRLKEYHPGAGTGKKKRPVRGIEVDEGEARWVRLMFDLYVNQGLGGGQIAGVINNPPYSARKRNGQPWDGPQILEVIKNPICCGRPAWGKSTYQSGRRVRKPAAEWTWSEVHRPDLAIIDEATWQKAQDIRLERLGEVTRGKRPQPARTFTSHLLLTGVASCGHCGAPLVTKTYSNRRVRSDGSEARDRYEGYTCRNHKRGAHAACPGTRRYWRREQIEEAVLDLVEQWFGQFDFEQVKARVLESYREHAGQAQAGLKAVQDEVEALGRRRRYYTEQLNLHLAGQPPRIPLSIVEEQLAEIEGAWTRAQQQLTELEQQRGARLVEEDTLARLGEVLPHWAEAFRQARPHQRKFLLSQVIDRVTVWDEHMEVAINVRIRELLDTAARAESELATAREPSRTSRPRSVPYAMQRGTADVRVPGSDAGPGEPVHCGQLPHQRGETAGADVPDRGVGPRHRHRGGGPRRRAVRAD